MGYTEDINKIIQLSEKIGMFRKSEESELKAKNEIMKVLKESTDNQTRSQWVLILFNKLYSSYISKSYVTDFWDINEIIEYIEDSSDPILSNIKYKWELNNEIERNLNIFCKNNEILSNISWLRFNHHPLSKKVSFNRDGKKPFVISTIFEIEIHIEDWEKLMNFLKSCEAFEDSEVLSGLTSLISQFNFCTNRSLKVTESNSFYEFTKYSSQIIWQFVKIYNQSINKKNKIKYYDYTMRKMLFQIESIIDLEKAIKGWYYNEYMKYYEVHKTNKLEYESWFWFIEIKEVWVSSEFSEDRCLQILEKDIMKPSKVRIEELANSNNKGREFLKKVAIKNYLSFISGVEKWVALKIENIDFKHKILNLIQNNIKEIFEIFPELWYKSFEE